MRVSSIALAAVLCAAATGCSSNNPAPVTTAGQQTANASASSATAPSKTKNDRNLLVTADLTEPQQQLSAYEVVQQLRPNWLHGSGAMTTGSRGLTVFMDGTNYGSLSTLKDVRMYELIDIKYLSASEASNRYGTGYEGGVLLARRKK